MCTSIYCDWFCNINCQNDLTFDWLPGDLVHCPHAPDLELVADHVAEALVVDDAEEDLGLHLDTI